MNLEDFKSNLAWGLSRPHSYKIQLQSPDRGFTESIGLFAEEAEIPGKGYGTQPVAHFGPSRKYPYQEIYTDFKLSIICSSDFFEKLWFEEWHNRISNPKSGYFYYPDTYVKDVIIQQLDGQDRVVYSGKALKAYPLSVDPMPLSYKVQNTYHVINVTFAYWKFISDYTDKHVSGTSGVPVNLDPGRPAQTSDNLPIPGKPTPG